MLVMAQKRLNKSNKLTDAVIFIIWVSTLSLGFFLLLFFMKFLNLYLNLYHFFVSIKVVENFTHYLNILKVYLVKKFL